MNILLSEYYVVLHGFILYNLIFIFVSYIYNFYVDETISSM